MSERESARKYSVDPSDLVEYLIDSEEEFIYSKGVPPSAVRNVTGLVDYLMAGFKNGLPPNLKYSSISFDLKGLGKESDIKQIGAFFIRDMKTLFDFVRSNSGEVVISSKTSILEIHIPEVQFSPGSNERITPGMVSRSFGMAADYMYLCGLNPEFVTGLTYSKMGRVSTRWGFTVEEKPFPEEIYRVIDDAIGVNKDYPKAIRDLTTLRNQVLVYQTKDSFMEMAKPYQRLT